mmetsp:Transcript_5404/g.14954  ORF Transcript_5404/g.14954 Transcript_5404/m.14954 type:complete len:95 (-) Transcript_5404:557-841(-)
MSRQDFPDCVEGEKGNELSNELSNMAWSVLALRINGWRYAGMLEAGAVTKAVCGRAKCCSGTQSAKRWRQRITHPVRYMDRKRWHSFNLCLVVS